MGTYGRDGEDFDGFNSDQSQGSSGDGHFVTSLPVQHHGDVRHHMHRFSEAPTMLPGEHDSLDLFL